MKILLVADHADWIVGVWAQKIIEHNPEYDFYFVTRTVCLNDQDVFPELARRVDLVFFMTPYYLEMYPLPKRVPIVTSIHHFVDLTHLQAALKSDLICYMADIWRPKLLDIGVDEHRLQKYSTGTDTTFFNPTISGRSARKQFGFRDSEFVIGFFAKKSSNECDRKNRAAAFSVITRLSNETGKPVRLLLTGPGWGSEDYCSIKENVTYVPFVEPKRMPTAYRALDVYLITSHVEGGPVPLLEAMASGVPVVSTCCGFAPEVIQHGVNGFLVDDVVHDGVRYIKELMESESLRVEIGSNARKTIEESRTWAQMVSPFPMIVQMAFENYRTRGKPFHSSIAFARYDRVYSEHWHWPDITHENPYIQQKAAVAYDRYLWREQLFRDGNRKLVLKMAFREYLNDIGNRAPLKQYLRMFTHYVRFRHGHKANR